MHAKIKVPHLTTEIQKVKDLVNDTQAKQKINLGRNLSIITNLLADFISSNHLLLYGGSALNLLLPAKHRFYSKQDLPDFDCLSEKPKTMILKAVGLLKSHGFDVYAKQGMHEGTYRLYYERYGIMDITRVMGGTYKKLLIIAIQEKKQASSQSMLTVPIMMLKSHMYQELANPYNSMYRLEKVYSRMMLFDLYFPIPERLQLPCEHEVSASPPPKEWFHALQFLHHKVKKHQYPVVGWSAAQLLNGKSIENVWNPCVHPKGYFPLEFICLENQIDLLWKHLLHPFQQKFSKASIKKKWYHSDVIPRRLIISISIDRIVFPLAIVFILYNRCYSVMPSKIDGFIVGSYDTNLFLLHLTYVMFQMYTPSRCTIVPPLIHDFKKQAEKTYLSKKSQRLSTKCMEILP